MSTKHKDDRSFVHQTHPDRAYRRLILVASCVVAVSLLGCSDEYKHSAVVAASAYNSVSSQGSGDPTVGAWGDHLEPGMKAIAVSRDLEELGLTQGVKVKIEGLGGVYEVMDKTNARFTERIDIYMGDDVDAAREWGRKEVTISWN